MAEIASSSERAREGEAALARGAWREARAIFERELEAGETVEALEGLSWAAWWVEDASVCFDARERAYRLRRQSGDMRHAAMLALWLADDHLVLRGERAIANGWFQRAARILEGLEPCPEHGWLDALLGYMALGEGDPKRARERALRARELGRRLGVVCLEMFALAVEGMALVNEGEVDEGMRCLDEATAAALAGEYEEIVSAGWTCCLLLGACERVRDYDRAVQWCRKVEEFSRRMRINFATGTCRAHYGAVLTWVGRWSEAERELTEATEDLSAERPSWTGAGVVRLADLRRRQGRFAEAEQLLHRAAGNALAPLVMAELALDRGEASAARDLVEPLLRRVPADNRSPRAAPLETIVRATLATGEVEAAGSHLSELRSIANELGTRPLLASASLSEGLVAAAAGDQETARARLEDAVELFAASGAAFELARAARTRGGVGLAGSRGRGRARGDGGAEASRRNRGSRRGGAGSRAAAAARCLAESETDFARGPAPHPATTRGPATGLGGPDGRGDRDAARAQQAHRSPPPSERVRHAWLLLTGGGGGRGQPTSPAVGPGRGLARTGHGQSWLDQAKTPPSSAPILDRDVVRPRLEREEEERR